MASFAVPLFLTPPAQAIGRARRGATGMAGRVVLVWSVVTSVPRVERARLASYFELLLYFNVFIVVLAAFLCILNMV
jgi:hypothetical protein